MHREPPHPFLPLPPGPVGGGTTLFYWFHVSFKYMFWSVEKKVRFDLKTNFLKNIWEIL